MFTKMINSYKDFIKEINKENPPLQISNKPDKIDEFWKKIINRKLTNIK